MSNRPARRWIPVVPLQLTRTRCHPLMLGTRLRRSSMGPLKKGLTVVALVGGCLMLGIGVSDAGEASGKSQAASRDSKSLDRLPAAVQKTAREQAAGAVIHSIGKELETG